MSIQIKVPEVGESITEVTLSKWLVEDGSFVEVDQSICEIESDKATFEIPAESAGIVRHIAEEGADLEIGALLCEIDEKAKAPAPKIMADAQIEAGLEKLQTAENGSGAIGTKTNEHIHISPVAATIVSDQQLDISKIKGTGANGRITKQDVMAYMQSGQQAEETTGLDSTAQPMKGEVAREERREPMSRLRRTIAARLVEAKNATAMLTTFNEVDMAPILDIRSNFKEKFKEAHGISLGFMSFFTRAVCIALSEFPAVNARIDEKDIVYHDYCDISIAISTPKGLVVPVIRNAESLSMAGIESAIADLATRGRNNELSLEEMTGGTFTISNGGVFGSLLSTPIINIPQSAILGMHNIQERAVVVEGQIVIRPMMYLALSYDHRIVDGKESVIFLVRVKELLENPELLISGKDPVLSLLGF